MDAIQLQEKLAPAWAVEAVDKLIFMKKKEDVWTVIEKIMEIWVKTKPNEWKSYLIDLKETKQTRKVTKGLRGVSKDKDTGGYLAYTVDVPTKVIKMIRAIYDPDELPMDKVFFRTFAKKFPTFKIMEKV